MCNTTNLAARGPIRFDYCSCGSIHLHLGPVMVRLDPSAVPHLQQVVQQGSERLARQCNASSGRQLPNAGATRPAGPEQGRSKGNRLPPFPDRN